MTALEKLATEINNIVNKKVRKPKLDITEDLDKIIDSINKLKPHIIDNLEIKFSNYLIDKCQEFKISVERKQVKYSFGTFSS